MKQDGLNSTAEPYLTCRRLIARTAKIGLAAGMSGISFDGKSEQVGAKSYQVLGV